MLLGRACCLLWKKRSKVVRASGVAAARGQGARLRHRDEADALAREGEGRLAYQERGGQREGLRRGGGGDRGRELKLQSPGLHNPSEIRQQVADRGRADAAQPIVEEAAGQSGGQ